MIVFHHRKHNFHLILHRCRKQEDLMVMTPSEHKQNSCRNHDTNSNLLNPRLQNDLALKETTAYPNLKSTAIGFRSNFVTKTTHQHSRDNPIASNTQSIKSMRTDRKALKEGREERANLGSGMAHGDGAATRRRRRLRPRRERQTLARRRDATRVGGANRSEPRKPGRETGAAKGL